MMIAACDDDNSGNEDNPVAGTNGNYCWKVTTTVLGTLPQVSYMWDTEAEVKLYVGRLQQAGLDVSYEKSSAKDYNECSELENNSGDENQGNIDDFFNTTKKYEQAEPGIYVNSEGKLDEIYQLPEGFFKWLLALLTFRIMWLYRPRYYGIFDTHADILFKGKGILERESVYKQCPAKYIKLLNFYNSRINIYEKENKK